MKKILTILLILISTTIYGQKPPCVEYPLYSDIWRMSCGSDGSHMFLPKESNSFALFVPPYFKNNLDEKKIESYLLGSLNEFRADYGKPPVKESKWLTKLSDAYSKKLINSFEHDYNQPAAENIASYPVTLFSLITEEDGDINKIIADAYFDLYIGSQSHTEMLLSDHQYFGFGITFDSTGSFWSCVRSCSSLKKLNAYKKTTY
jgi:uncharacterized protein YkwD